MLVMASCSAQDMRFPVSECLPDMAFKLPRIISSSFAGTFHRRCRDRSAESREVCTKGRGVLMAS